MKSIAYVAALFCLVASASAQEARVVESGRQLRFGNSHLQLTIDKTTGRLVGLAERAGGVNVLLGGDVDIQVRGRRLIADKVKPLPKFVQPGVDLRGEWRFRTDPKQIGLKEGWHTGDAAAWRTLHVPGDWETQGVTGEYQGMPEPRWKPYNGVAWYRRDVALPAELKGKNLKLYIGAVDDLDEVYVNGTLVGQTTEMAGRWYDTPRVYDVPGRLVKEAHPLKLAVRVFDRGGEGGILKGPVWLGTAEDVDKAIAASEAAVGELTYRSHKVVRGQGAATLEVVSRFGQWDIVSRYTLRDSDGVLIRDAEFIYRGDEPADFVRVTTPQFSLKGVGIGDASRTCYTILASYPPTSRSFGDLVEGRKVGAAGAGSTARSVMVHNAQLAMSLVTAFYSETETANVRVEELADKINIIHELHASDRLRRGLRMPAGRQLIRLVRGPEADALQAIQDFYKVLGVDLPADSPPDAPRAVIYSAHAGGTIDSHFRDVGGFRNFAKMIPFIHDLGATTIWLLPFWHGRVYAPYDYYRLDEHLGTPDDLKALTDLAHKYHMRVLGDLIPHGPRDELGFHKQHPDWICRDKSGEMIYWWGCLYCDYANPGWQGYMADHAAYWVKKCGLDGYRVDVAGGGPPNWRPYNGNRPSFSGLWGGLHLLEAARRKVKEVNPNAVFLPEAAGPYYFKFAEYTYDWPFIYLVVKAHLLREPIAEWCDNARRYLEYQKYEHPARANLMRFLENHDTVRARMRYGVGLHRALLAMCAFIKGVPFLYHEQEVGDEGYVRRLYRIRARFDELTLGTGYYTAASAEPPAVMTFLRKHGKLNTVVAVNFNNRPVDARIKLPVSLMGLDPEKEWGLFEAFRGKRLTSPAGKESWSPKELARVTVKIGAYEPAVLVVRPPARLPPGEKPPAPPAKPKDANPRVERSGRTVILQNGHYRVVIDGSRGGLLKEIGPAGGANFLKEMTFGEGKRKIFIGSDRLDFARTRVELTVEQPAEDKAIVRARGRLTRPGGQPALDYALSYEADRGPRLGFRCELAPLIDVRNVKAELMLRLRMRPTSHWFARTAEGPLFGECIFRHPFPDGFPGRYWHAAGEAFYRSGLYPLDPDRPCLGVFDEEERSGIVLHGPSSLLGDVAIVEDKGADSPKEIGKRAAPAIVLTLFGGDSPITLSRGKKETFGFDIEVVHDMAQGLAERLRQPAGQAGEVHWQAGSSNYTISNKHMKVVIGRYGGGRLRSLTSTSAKDESLIYDSEFYSDYGLYGPWTDPRGVKHQTNARTTLDPEPDTRFSRDAERMVLQFTSFFRHPHASGRNIMSPRLQYQVAYQVDRGPRLRVRCGVRPMMVKAGARAFLAQVVRMRPVDQWSVNDGEWHSLTAEDEPGRLWESRKEGALPAAFAVRDSHTGRTVRFADFEAVGSVQNIFLHNGGDGRATLFIAFLDGVEVDVRPEWRRAGYSIQVGADK